MSRPNVFTILPGAPFLPTLVEALLAGRLVPGFDPAAHPFALADVTLYLPTRRAARAVRETFLRALGRPVLLPKIRTLGDIDEDELLFELDLLAGEAEVPAAIPAAERQLTLTRLVLGWSRALARRAAELPAEEADLIPASPADAARLSGALGGLIDQVGVRPDGWAPLFGPLDADLARYWEITRDFLGIAVTAWPEHLAARGLVDPGVRRDRLVRAEAARLAAHGSAAPIIAAGSTGSVPATAALLAAIAGLPNGAVVLPGLDLGLDPEGWEAVGPAESDPAGAGHPQYGLKVLLRQLGVERSDVASLGDEAPAAARRARFVSEALRPAATTEHWSAAPPLSGDALEGLAVLEAANEREEALAVAVILREAVEKPGRVAALVTPDRALARRVAVELRRWDIVVDDSGGRPLAVTPPGVLARLVAETAFGSFAPETLLALAKHPLAAFGLSPSDARRGARALERAVLRGPRLRPGLAALRHAFDAARAETAKPREERRPTQAQHSLSRNAWAHADDLLARLAEALQPLEALGARAGLVPFDALLPAHRAALAAVATTDNGEPALEEAGEALDRVFAEIGAAAGAAPAIVPRDYPDLFAALLDGHSIRRRGGLDPRIHIWGTLEARLQSVDLAVLGGLNEQSWPSQTELDPLLSRVMRAALQLDPPERRLGLSAHDFAQGLGHSQVWLTRAERQDGEPRVASRWLQRLMALAGKAGRERLAAPAAAIRMAVRTLDRAGAPSRAVERPDPKPPRDLRPRKLTATQIETLIRDPYAIYAREVLRLRPLEPVGRLPDAAERGNLFHGILEQFIRARPSGPFDAAARADLLRIGREHFAAFDDFPEFGALWWPRFEKMATWFVAEEAARPGIARRLVEGTGEIAVADVFRLRARADRIDVLEDGRLAIIDYKTGRTPSADEVLSLAPQLPLEAIIAERGGFAGIAAAEVAQLDYYRLSGQKAGGERHPRGVRAGQRKPDVTLRQTLAETARRLDDLVAWFDHADHGYLSRKIPKRGRVYAGDYDHLARVAEWQVAEDEEDE